MYLFKLFYRIMGINLCRLQIGMTQHLLYGDQTGSFVKQMRGKSMSVREGGKDRFQAAG